MAWIRISAVWGLIVAIAGWAWTSEVFGQYQTASTNTELSQQAVLFGEQGPYPSTNMTPNVASSPAVQVYSGDSGLTKNASNNVLYGDVAGTSGMPGAVAPTSSFKDTISTNGSISAPIDSSAGAANGNDYVQRVLTGEEEWKWQLLPSGLLFRSYLAGPYEGRLSSRWDHVDGQGWVWDATLGARFGLFRYGTDNPILPQGWQIDMEGVAMPRLDDVGDVVGNDYVFSVPLTMRQGPWEWKAGYRHYCSHIADEYLLKHPGFPRLNYVRDSMYTALAYYVTPSLRLYGEAGYGFHCDDGAEPWEFQFGIDWSSPAPTTKWGAPFFAANGHLRQENDFGGNFTIEAGWQWRGETGRLFRIGGHYFNGKSEQCQFYKNSEEQVGFGAWYDF